MSKLTKVAAGMAVVPMLAFAAPAFADSPGQLEGGSIVYQIKNATQSGSYGAAASATCNDELKYSVRLHNTEFGKISSIVVSTTQPSAGGTSNMTATGTNSAGTAVNTSGSVSVTLGANQTLAYEAGTTALYDGNAQLIKSLPDGIATTAGVNAGDLNGSTTEFVTFKAKVTCATPPVTPPVTPPAVVKPTRLVNTGPGEMLGLFAVVTVAGAFGYRTLLSRRLNQN